MFPTRRRRTGRAGADIGPADWVELHGGAALPWPARLWVRGVQRLARARPVAAVPPDVLTLAGVLAAAGAVAAAAAGSGWAPLAALFALLTGLLDGLDGAVALGTGRARPLGAVLDAVADRIGDLAFAAVLALLGAPPAWCAAAAALVLLHEYVRARAQAEGMRGPGAVTVAERPTRIVLVVVAAAATGLWPAGTPWTGWGWATVCAVGWVVVGAIGLVQLGASVVRDVPATTRAVQPGPTSSATIPADSTTSGSPPPGCAEPPTR